MAGRTSYWPRGKMLGGSSSINAMIFVRGQRHDFDDWKAAGNPGWGWDDVLPHFKSFENFEGGSQRRARQRRAAQRHRHGGQRASALRDFLDAAEQAGFSSARRTTTAPSKRASQSTRSPRTDGMRASSATAFLRPAMRRPNLQVVTGAFATRILFEGRQAVGVEYVGPRAAR